MIMEDRKLIIQTIEEKVEKLNAEMQDAEKLKLYDKAAKCQHQIEALDFAMRCVKTL